MRDELMRTANVSEHIAAAALGWALENVRPPAGDDPTSEAVAQWRDRLEVAMYAYARGMATMETQLIDRARGARDDLRVLAQRLGRAAAHHYEESLTKLGADHAACMVNYRRLRGASDAYEVAVNLIAHSFAIPERRDDDPETAHPIRMLDDDGEPAPDQTVYTVPGALWKGDS